jgi:hypothetical protein
VRHGRDPQPATSRSPAGWRSPPLRSPSPKARPCRRDVARGSAIARYPAPARGRRSRDHLRGPALNRQHRDHPYRPPTIGSDDSRRQRPQTHAVDACRAARATLAGRARTTRPSPLQVRARRPPRTQEWSRTFDVRFPAPAANAGGCRKDPRELGWCGAGGGRSVGDMVRRVLERRKIGGCNVRGQQGAFAAVHGTVQHRR